MAFAIRNPKITFTISKCPYSQARWRGVDPDALITLTDAPRSKRISTAATLPNLVALVMQEIVGIMWETLNCEYAHLYELES